MATRYDGLIQSAFNFDLDDLDTIKQTEWFSLVVPKVLMFLGIFLLPFVGAIWISLHQWSLLSQTKPFIGLQNYIALFQDPLFYNSIINTTGYAIALLAIDVPLALFLAVLLNKRLRGTQFYSAAIFTPVVTSYVVVSLIWTFIYNPDFGLANMVLESLGLPTIAWLRDTKTALASIAILGIWKNVGFNMVIFLAGLRSIPETYYEAARIDGANAWQRFRYVTLPLLKSTTFFVVVIELIGSFRLFTPVFVMTRGGPIHSSYSLVFFFYRKGFAQFKMGYASAIAVVLFIVVFTLSLIQRRTWGEDVEY